MRNRLIVLSYHRVIPTADPLFPEQTTAKQFELQLKVLARFFRVFTLSDALSLLDQKKLPARAVAITFDDGYADNATEALPLLMQYGLKATFFITTQFINGGLMWNDKIIEAIRLCQLSTIDLESLDLGSFKLGDDPSRRSAIDTLLQKLKHVPEPQRSNKVNAIVDATGSVSPERMMMSGEQLALLSENGMEIGAHTVSHPILAKQSNDDAEYEITESRKELRRLLGVPVSSFAYPNGRPGADYDERHVTHVRNAGFGAAVSTQDGVVRITTDRLQLPRYGPWDTSQIKFTLRLFRWLLKG